MRPNISEVVVAFKEAEKLDKKEARKKFYSPKSNIDRDEITTKYNAKLNKLFYKNERDKKSHISREKSKILTLLEDIITDLDRAIKENKNIQKDVRKKLDKVLNGGYEL